MAGPVWVELHVDDEIIEGDPGRWPEAAALVRRVATLAEARGARLSFRLRAPFARGARGSELLPALERAGHEVGAHAHGRGLAEVCQALVAAGVQARVATPGLVQARDRAGLLREAARLGFSRVTDHGPTRSWAYEGLLPRREEGLVVMAPTVRPPDWGLMSRTGERWGLRDAAVARLRELERRAFDDHGAAAFGVALHEHDLCAPGSLVPRQEALDALASYLDGRVVRSFDLPLPTPLLAPQPARPLRAQALRLARAVGLAAERARGGRPLPRGVFSLPVRPGRGARAIAVERHGVDEAHAVLVVSHAGPRGGRKVAFTPFGAGIHDVVGLGFAVYLYDRAGTGDSPAAGPLGPGNPAHDEDWRAVLAMARQEGLPVVALSYSAGVLPVLRAAAAGVRPDALVDAEAPADRWSLVPPYGNDLSALDCWDDAAWAGIEPVRLLPSLGAPYARLQAELDHVHGPMPEHARRMIEAARRAGLTVRDPAPLAGHLHGHPVELFEALTWAVRAMDRR